MNIHLALKRAGIWAAAGAMLLSLTACQESSATNEPAHSAPVNSGSQPTILQSEEWEPYFVGRTDENPSGELMFYLPSGWGVTENQNGTVIATAPSFNANFVFGYSEGTRVAAFTEKELTALLTQGENAAAQDGFELLNYTLLPTNGPDAMRCEYTYMAGASKIHAMSFFVGGMLHTERTYSLTYTFLTDAYVPNFDVTAYTLLEFR
ncbi:MAG: hypothetical protein HFJ79_10285 [Clostridiales bacterium]|nr:hypothetical protein [Clostridiales bacterium]